MQLRSRQRGLGALGWLVTLAVASFALTCVLKIGPVYMDYWELKGTLDNVIDDRSLAGLPRGELLTTISKRFMVNRIEAIDVKDIAITDTREGRVMDATYEKRVPLLANIDVVVKFDDLTYALPPR